MPVRAETVAGRTGKICRSGQARVASPAHLPFPLNREVELIQVGFAEAPLGDFEESGVLELFLIGAYAALGRAHIVGEPSLARKKQKGTSNNTPFFSPWAPAEFQIELG